MRIGELSRRTGLSRDTLRFYEREGLIRSEDSAEPSNTYRDYAEETVERLAMIVQAREAGFTVADLRTLFQGLDGMVTDAFEVEAFLDAKMEQLRALIRQSRKLLQMLEATKAALAP